MSIPENMAQLAEWSFDQHGERSALWYQGQFYKNTDILDKAKRLQGAFIDMGIGKGDNVCICMINHPSVYSIFGGVFRTGATAVPVMFALTAHELKYIFSHTECAGVCTDSMLVEKVREAVQGLAHIKWLAILDGTTDETKSPKEYRLQDLMQHDPENSIPNVDAEQDVALMLYTSGTTGKPKGVMLTHANLMASGRQGVKASENHLRNHPARSISSLPMAHIFGVGVMNAGYLLPKEFEPGYGVSEIWFDPERFMQLIQEHRVTDLAVVPTMLSMIVSHPKLREYDLSSLAVVAIGAAPVPEEVAQKFSELTGCRMKQLYGMTENAGMSTCDRISKPYRPMAAGLPYDETKIRVVDDNQKDMPAGQAGEIIMQGPSMMKGYYKQPDVTADTVKNGWLHTGDIGYLDPDGYLFVVDRKKDMIIKGGENIFPAEVENALYEHPDVAEAAVIGVPDPKFGEVVVAFVVAMPNRTIDEAQIIAHVKKLITPFKAPSKVIQIPNLPKSGVGKILRRELREMLSAK